jgi:hypothetical protein
VQTVTVWIRVEILALQIHAMANQLVLLYQTISLFAFVLLVEQELHAMAIIHLVSAKTGAHVLSSHLVLLSVDVCKIMRNFDKLFYFHNKLFICSF